eukprot:1398916-Amphidinium_carterae.1
MDELADSQVQGCRIHGLALSSFAKCMVSLVCAARVAFHEPVELIHILAKSPYRLHHAYTHTLPAIDQT